MILNPHNNRFWALVTVISVLMVLSCTLGAVGTAQAQEEAKSDVQEADPAGPGEALRADDSVWVSPPRATIMRGP